jgi:5-methylcytosine-specific restriction endonuclease McrA
MNSIAFENRRVLVLNKNWFPIGIESLRDAILKLFSCHHDGHPKARIIDPQDYQTFTWADWAKLRPEDESNIISSVKQSFKVPTVIQLCRYDKMPHQQVRFSRRSLFRRDDYRCQYCGCRPGTAELTVDHIIPRSAGGLTTWDNCVSACVQCNTQKSNRRPEEAFKYDLSSERQKLWRGPTPMKLLSKPKKPRLMLGKKDKEIYLTDWSHFMSEVYFEVELDNDMKE